jgi:GT2 family glycosyltransferase
VSGILPQSISVVAVTYNSSEHVIDALISAEKAAADAGLDLELLVIDNASDDGTAALVRQEFPDAVVVENASNVGFARANNQAFERAVGDVWLLLNPDAAISRSALGPLLEQLWARPRAGAVAPSISPPWDGGPEAGGMQPSIRSVLGHFFWVNRLLPGDRGGPWRGMNLARRPALGPRRVEWASAAVLLLRPEAVRDVRGFDERFFLYGEDLDFGDRLDRAGWETWLVPNATATHLYGGSQNRVSTGWVDAAHDRYSERSPRWRTVFFDAAFALGLTLRAALSGVHDRSDDARVRAQVVRASARRAWSLVTRRR